MLSTCSLSVSRPPVTDLWLRASGGKGTVGVRDAMGHPSCRGNLKHMSLLEAVGSFPCAFLQMGCTIFEKTVVRFFSPAKYVVI